MGGNQSSELPAWMREEVARREANAKVQVEVERVAAAKAAGERDALYEKLRELTETSNERIQTTIEQKDQELQEVIAKNQEALSMKEIELKKAFERSLDIITSSNEKIIELEAEFRERKKADDDKWNEKLTAESNTATEKILMINKENAEMMERKLAETYSIFQDEKKSLKQTIKEKDQAVKQTYEKLVETQKDGIAMTVEMRKQMELEKQKEIEKVEGKLKVKEEEIKVANDKILEVHEKGVKMANDVRIQKERELEEIIKKTEARHKEENQMFKEFYQHLLTGEKERVDRLEQMIKHQSAETRRLNDKMLQIKDEVITESSKRREENVKYHQQITDLYERLLEQSRQTALKDNLEYSIQMMGCISSFQNSQLNQQPQFELMNNMLKHTNYLSTQIEQSNLKSGIDTRVQQNQIPEGKTAGAAAAPKITYCKFGRPFSPYSSEGLDDSSLFDEGSSSEKTGRETKADNELRAEIAVKSLIGARTGCLIEEMDIFFSNQTENIEKLKKVCEEIGWEGTEHETLGQGSQFWENVIRKFQQHSSSCQSIVQSFLQDLEDLLKENLSDYLLKNPLSGTIVDTKAEESVKKFLDTVSCLIEKTECYLKMTFGKHKYAIEGMNNNFMTSLTSYNEGLQEEKADKMIDFNEISAIYFTSLEEEIKECQILVSGELKANFEELVKTISLIFNS